MKIGLVQKNLTIGDFAGNVDRLIDGITTAAGQGAALAVCSELALCGYPPRDLLDRPDFVAANLTALDELARRTPIPTIVGYVTRHTTSQGAPRLRNSAALVAGGTVRSVHHKSLLPTYDVFDEWRYFEPTDQVELARVAEVAGVAELGGLAIGISICEDIWNDADFWPERRYRSDPVAEQAALGAELLVNISASPFTVHKRSIRPRMLAAQARKHRLPLIVVNQVGGNDDLVFDGASAAFSADGSLAARAAELAEDVVVVSLDRSTGQITGPGQDGPAGDVVAGDAAAALAALVLGTRDYVHKCGFRSALVGLSGGVDSALTAAIAARALGPDNVHGVAMPSRYSSEHSLRDARALARALGIHYQVIPIEGPFQALLDVLGPAFGDRPPDFTEENLQARCRGMILMALSNKHGHIVLTTGNKSESAVGYCTLYGDMSGGLAVISDVPKTMVYELARELDRQAGHPVIPPATLSKPPSAELRPGQLDQDSLPPYDVLDAILALYIEDHASRAEIIACGHDPDVVDRVLDLVHRSEYKRNQAAPGIKIRQKTFGPGRRLPIAARWSR